jgi:NAD(P)H dehydrogenase (quinone)
MHVGAHAMRADGHEVEVSDLYAMGFDPVSDRRNFATVRDSLRLKQQAEEEFASDNDGFVPELAAEMDKLARCDVLVLSFPLWWLGMPAILKGWVDRVFAAGRANGGGRYYDRGMFAGKRAICAITVGGSPAAYSEVGLYGPLAATLYPIHHGILAFTGFSVVEPFVVHGPARMREEDRQQRLLHYVERLRMIEALPVLPAPATADFAGMVRIPQVAATA